MSGSSNILISFCCIIILASAKNLINHNHIYYDPNAFQFVCTSGESIPRDQECDGIINCEDSSDETDNCRTLQCPSYLYRCHYGACIDPGLSCDGKNDCKDGSDEIYDCKPSFANSICKDHQFRCNSGQCIEDTLKCDGSYDCNDKSDEIKSTCWSMICPGYTFRCNYGACVDGTSPCNGITDCVDDSDEKPYYCKNNSQIVDSCVVSDEFMNSSFVLGALVEPGTTVTVQCNNARMNDVTFAVCKQGLWIYPLGNCSTRASIIINIFLNITINNQSQIQEATTEDDSDKLIFPR